MPKKESLSHQLEEARKSEQYYRGQANVLSDSVRRLEKDAEQKAEQERMKMHSRAEDLKSEVDRLMEIIRWQINPDTTRYPFVKDKSQMTEREIDRRF